MTNRTRLQYDFAIVELLLVFIKKVLQYLWRYIRTAYGDFVSLKDYTNVFVIPCYTSIE